MNSQYKSYFSVAGRSYTAIYRLPTFYQEQSQITEVLCRGKCKDVHLSSLLIALKVLGTYAILSVTLTFEEFSQKEIKLTLLYLWNTTIS